MGVYHNLIREPDVEKIASARLEVCRGVEGDKKKKKCDFYVNKSIERCGSCGCPLALRTRSIKSGCPEKKWLAITE